MPVVMVAVMGGWWKRSEQNVPFDPITFNNTPTECSTMSRDSAGAPARTLFVLVDSQSISSSSDGHGGSDTAVA